MKHLYATYDTTVGTKQMARVCPTARAAGTAELKDYRMMFRGKHGAAVATVEPLKGTAVPVMLWELSEAEENKLNQSMNCPTVFRKEIIAVIQGRKRVRATVYTMCDEQQISAPGRYYYSLLVQGYREHGFDERRLTAALIASAKEDNLDDPND